MSDPFNQTQRTRIKALFDQYSNFSEIDKSEIVSEIARVIQCDGFDHCLIMREEQFKPNVRRTDFFVKLINTITGVIGPINITRPISRIMHFNWYYGAHNNFYRIKCFAFNYGRLEIVWWLEKLIDNNEDEHSEDFTDDTGMNVDNIEDGEESESEELRSTFVCKPDAMHTILTAIESLHKRLCKLGV